MSVCCGLGAVGCGWCCAESRADAAGGAEPACPSLLPALPCLLCPALPPPPQVKGQKVVVKVQRPGLKELFDIDLKNVRVLAQFLQKVGGC